MIAPIVSLLSGLFALFNVDVDPGILTELATGLAMIAAAVYSIWKSKA